MKKLLLFLILGMFLVSMVSAYELCNTVPMDDCPSGYVGNCQQDGSGDWYYTCDYNGEPQCPSDFPYYCPATELCYGTPYRCVCSTKTCQSKCIDKILYYEGECPWATGNGECQYKTESVECCFDFDCGFGLLCSGNKCVQPSVSGENLGFEEWSTSSSPIYWDTMSNVFFVNRETSISEGNFALGFTGPDTPSVLSGCSNFVQATQQIDLTNIDEIKFDCWSAYSNRMCGNMVVISGDTGEVSAIYKTKFLIDSNEFSVEEEENTINTASYSGLHTIKFYHAFCASGSWGGSWTDVRFDNIRLINSYKELLEIELQKQIDYIISLKGDIFTQATLISELGVSLDEKIIIVNSLTDEINEKLILISQLQLLLEDKKYLVAELTDNIEEQALIILQMQETVSNQVEIINSLELSIEEQAQMINSLTINLQEKAELLSQLQVTNENQAELIKLMELSFSDQADIINSLNKEISDDAEIIQHLDLNIQEQAELISYLKLTNEDQAKLIDDLNLKISEQTEMIKALQLDINGERQLVESLNITLEEKNQLLDSLLSYSKIPVYKLFWNNYKFWIIGMLIMFILGFVIYFMKFRK